MDGRKDTAVEALLEHLFEHGPSDIATVFGRAFVLAMQIERERFLRARPYERTAERQGLRYSAAAMLCALSLRAVIRLPLRQTQGFLLRAGE